MPSWPHFLLPPSCVPLAPSDMSPLCGPFGVPHFLALLLLVSFPPFDLLLFTSLYSELDGSLLVEFSNLAS